MAQQHEKNFIICGSSHYIEQVQGLIMEIKTCSEML